MSLSSDLSVMDVRLVSFKNSKKSSPVWLSTDNFLLAMIKNKNDQQTLTRPRLNADADLTQAIFTFRRKCWSFLLSFMLVGSTHGRCGYVCHDTGLRYWIGQTRRFKTGAPTHCANLEKRNLSDWNYREARKTVWKQIWSREKYFLP